MDADGNMSVSLIGLLTPFPLLVGATTIAMFAMHGEPVPRRRRPTATSRLGSGAAVPRLIAAFFVLNTIVVVAMVLFREQITARYVDDIWPVIFPAAALLALIAGLSVRAAGASSPASLASAATIALLADLGRRRACSRISHLDHGPCLQPDDLQRRRRRRTPSSCA